VAAGATLEHCFGIDRPEAGLPHLVTIRRCIGSIKLRLVQANVWGKPHAVRRISRPTRHEAFFDVRFPRTLAAVSVVLGVVGGAYLCAVVFGYGIHGLKGTASLDRSGSFPDANVAFIGAIFAWLAGPYGIAIAGYLRVGDGRRYARLWLGLTILGVVAFAVTRLVL